MKWRCDWKWIKKFKMIETAKLASIFILLGISAFSGIVSCLTVKCLVSKLGSSSKLKRAISILTCFSGGVFFATSVLSLLPEARESMEQALEHYDVHFEYPFTELAMCVGFFLILTLEHVAHLCCSSRSDSTTRSDHRLHPEKVSNIERSGIKYDEPTVGYKKENNKMKESVIPRDPIIVRSDFEDSSYHDDITYKTYGTVDESVDKSSVRPYSPLERDSSTPNMREIVFGDSDRILIKEAKVEKTTKKISTRHALQEAQTSTNQDPVRSKLRGLILLIALSLHMIFDGLALGLLKESQKIWGLLAALSLHKGLVFFTIGVQTLEILASIKKTIIVIVIFSLISPCGILIGESINISDDSVTKDMMSAILQGIATGTFLYVTFFEILQHELGSDDHDLLKVFITTLGFVFVAVIRLLENEGGH